MCCWSYRSSVKSVASESIVLNPTAAKLQEILVARIASDNEGAIGTGVTYKVAFVVKPRITVSTEPKLEQNTLLVTFVFREIHKGNVRDGVGIIGVSCRREVVKEEFIVVLIIISRTRW